MPLAVVEEPRSSLLMRDISPAFGMARSAIGTGVVDYVLPLEDIAPMLVQLVAESNGSPKPHRVAV
jgi:chemotaxis response regulator CheB